jgi:hypothetical protein
MNPISADLWKKIVTNAETHGQYVMSFDTNHSFGIFSSRDKINDMYKQCVNETPCYECKEVITIAYVQWKNNDWRYICNECFLK